MKPDPDAPLAQALSNSIAQEPMKMEGYGLVTHAPGTVQFIITVPRGTSPDGVGIFRSVLQAACREAHAEGDVTSLWEERAW